MVEVKKVETRRQLKEFITFPARLYRNNPNWLPDILIDELTNLDPAKNPSFEFCDAELFLAYKNGECAGRIAAIINHNSNKIWGQNRARFSRADFIDNDEVVDALLETAETCAIRWGCDEIHGPLGMTDFDKEGQLIDGFDQIGTFFTYYNAPYYQKQFERKGYSKDIDWVEYLLRLPAEQNEKIARLADTVQRRTGVTRHHIKSRKDLMAKIGELIDLINVAYADLYGVTPLNEKQKKHYVGQFVSLINPDYLIVLTKDEKVCAFGLGLLSMSRAVQKSRGRLLPFGWLRLLRATKVNDRIDLALVAVQPDMQKAGLPAILMNEMTKACIKGNVRFAESNPELETNQQVQALWKHYDAVQHKRRRCYVKKLT